MIGYVSDLENGPTVDGREYRETSGAEIAPWNRRTKSTIVRNPGDCKVGRAVGGGKAVPRKGARGAGAVTALSHVANDGDWTGRIMRKDRGTSRRVTRSTVPGFVQTPEMAARVAARKALRQAMAA
jgi:hypothetical protein